jgi:putative ubiquitin-RnfH superfamily antitoxin RatB of RatAB toxin-antitoxin module
MAEAMLGIDVCYAVPRRSSCSRCGSRPAPPSARRSSRAGCCRLFPEINLVTQPVGIYGKKKTLDTVLRERDRIEIYRPLVADPKDSRRKRAAKKANG